MSIQRGVARTITFGSLTTAGAANTATTPTVVVSKDAGAQAAAANAPTHLGNGSWALALTAAEMAADLVSVTAYGAGLVPSYREFYTEADFTPGRAAKLDNLDAAVSTRLAPGSVLAAPRALDAVADGAVTVNDALWCAVAGAAGKESVTGTAYVVKTPSTGTVLRTFTLDDPTTPTTRS